MISLPKTLRRGMLSSFALVALGVFLGRGWPHSDPFAALSQAAVQASTASADSRFALATGVIEEDAEGIFVLDYQSGLLKCFVLNHRTGKFGSVFHADVTKQLGPAKEASYQMTTGVVDFNRMSASGPGTAVVYVLNSANGELATYAIPWQREISAAGRPQVGELKALDGVQVRR